MIRQLLTAITVLLLITAAQAEVIVSQQPQVADDGWPVSSIEAAGFDREIIAALSKELEAGEFPNRHAVLVEYDGKLVYEVYMAGPDQSWGRDLGIVQYDIHKLHDLRSISKSVTALLLGIALGDGFKTELSKPIADFFPEYRPQMAPGAEKITLEQLLTMTTGLEWNEMQLPYSNRKNDEIQLYYNQDPIAYVLSKPMRELPGERWYYNGGTTMVLAALVEKISGKSFLEFAHETLFTPLGIAPDNIEWLGLGIWPNTLPSAASGLRLRTRDLAKIGSLMLHGGQWRGDQVVPAGWVEASSRRQVEQNSEWDFNGQYGYSYQWWHGRFDNKWGKIEAITGVGYGGQRLFIIPAKKLSVTIYSGNYAGGDWWASEKILWRIVAAAP